MYDGRRVQARTACTNGKEESSNRQVHEELCGEKIRTAEAIARAPDTETR